jgi:hypothetical protein
MEVADSSKEAVNIYQTTWHHLQGHKYNNLNSHDNYTVLVPHFSVAIKTFQAYFVTLFKPVMKEL